MSLVSEALRKARQEGRLPQTRRHLPWLPLGGRDGGRGVAPGWVAALVLGAALGGGSVAWFLVRPSPGTGPAAVVPSETGATSLPADAGGPPESPAVAALSGESASASEEVRSGTAHTSTPAAGPPAGESTRPLDVPSTAAPAERDESSARPVTPSPDERKVARAAAQGAAGEVVRGPERVYVLDADLGYAKLHLDFLVYKPSAPFGSLNGQSIVPGSIVAGLRVDEIGPDFVRLSDAKGTVILKVR